MPELRCAHCDRTTSIPEPAPAIVECEHCDRSTALPASATRHTTLRPAQLGASRPAWSQAGSGQGSSRDAPTTEVGILRSVAVAVSATVLFYYLLVAPLSHTYFGELFGDRGWVPYVITLLSAWALAVLAFKLLLLSGQAKPLELDLLPDSIASRITPENAHVFSSYLRQISPVTARIFLIERLARAIQHLRARRSAQEVVDQLANQAQADANAVDSSYAMLRVVIWAIPILGFIGTVLGIGAAVGGFSDTVGGAVDLDVMKQSIGSVTTGLALAFDTTLLALVMSIFIMFPASSLQKAEETLLARIEDYCEEHLVRRLDVGAAHSQGNPQTSGGPLSTDDAAAEGMARGVGRLEHELTRLAHVISDLESRLARIGRS